MMKVYESYISDNDGTDISFPGYFLGKDAHTKAKHAKEDRARKARKNKTKK